MGDNTQNKAVKGMVSVIIVNWNGLKFLEACLTSLFNQTYKNFEVILVDNASIDGSIEYVRNNFKEVKIVLNRKNYGFAVGNHIGLEKCNGEYIFLLNNDTEVHAEVLMRLVNAVKPDNVAGACGKIFSLSDKGKCIFTLPKIDHLTGKAVWVDADSEMRPVDYLSGNSMLLKRKVIDELGFLDKTYFAYFEETDLCARIIRAGYDLLYVPDVTVWHKEFGSTPTWFNRYYMMRNQVRFVLKNFDLKYIPHAIKENLKDIRRGLKKNKDAAPAPTTVNGPAFSIKKLVFKAMLWNIMFLPNTLFSRLRDLSRIRNKRSYNENLPLKDFFNQN